MIQNYFILTDQQSATAISLSSRNAEIAPRVIDNGSPGAGLNLNDHADGVGLGEAVTLTGKLVAPKRVVDDPAYPDAMKTFFLTLPWAALENETIFAPVE